MHDNEFTENTGTYIVEFNMNSHTPYTRWVDARFGYNLLKRNMKPLTNSNITTATSKPTTYALGVRGLQNVTINRNLFSNHLDFELLGGQTSSLLENYLDVTENYWGTVDQVIDISLYLVYITDNKLCSVECNTLSSVEWGMLCSVECMLCSAECMLCSVECMLCSVEFMLCSVE